MLDSVTAEDFNEAFSGIAADFDGKVDKVEGKVLSTNDYTTAEKRKPCGT